MSLTDLYVYDKEMKRIHKIGDEQHDALYVSNGEIRYHNLQNGDGGGIKDEEGYGYVILQTDDGFLEDEFGIIDKRFEKEIAAYLAEPVPTQTYDDAISRTEIIGYIDRLSNSGTGKGKSLEYLRKYAEKSESALPVRPSGEWIANDDFVCNQCGYHMVVGGGFYNYCPKCGAQMKCADME